MAFVRPVLEGVLYRAGFSSGDRSRSGLSGEQRRALCEAGFSGTRYIDFGTKTAFGTTSCGANALEYAKGSSSRTHDLMQDVHAVTKASGDVVATEHNSECRIRETLQVSRHGHTAPRLLGFCFSSPPE